jgi:hypothetical protein
VRWLEALLHLLDDLINAKAPWPLTRRVFFEGGEEFSDNRLRGKKAPATFPPSSQS